MPPESFSAVVRASAFVLAFTAPEVLEKSALATWVAAESVSVPEPSLASEPVLVLMAVVFKMMLPEPPKVTVLLANRDAAAQGQRHAGCTSELITPLDPNRDGPRPRSSRR